MRYHNFFIPLFGLFCLHSLQTSARSIPLDSIGTEWKNGKTLIVYQVTPGQTLYSLLKKYNVTLDEFKAVNPDFSGNLRSESVVRIPRPWRRSDHAAPATATSVGATSVGATNSVAKTHKVESGQTLFSIARKYEVGTAELKKWNNIPADGTVKFGQVLYVSDPGKSDSGKTEVAAAPVKTPVTEPRKPEPTKAEPVKTEAPKAPVVVNKPEVAVQEPPKKADTTTKTKPEAAPQPTGSKPVTTPKPEAEVLTPVRTENDPVPNASTGAKKVTEIGLCELIDAQDKSGKYLALHRSAPVGTMLTVRNEANNQSVIVKVIGKLPDTGPAGGVIVRLSARAFEKLMPTDRRVRAEVSYLAVEQ
ncbi:LysM repeat protein [Siphonobacter sp. BAB-5404]|nr:LysM repeat protein [Siphonobacter sp. SORGH_AS_0500]